MKESKWVPKYSSNGPDMTDVETMMRAIEALHGGQVQLTVTPAGISATGGMAVVLTYLSPTPAAGKFFEDLIVTSRWPCPQHREFWSCIYEGLYVLDGKIGRAYQQQKLPEA